MTTFNAKALIKKLFLRITMMVWQLGLNLGLNFSKKQIWKNQKMSLRPSTKTLQLGASKIVGYLDYWR